MSKADWNTTDRILYGVMAGGIVLWAIATFIEACRPRPKLEMIILAGKEKEVKQPAKIGPDESSSATK